MGKVLQGEKGCKMSRSFLGRWGVGSTRKRAQRPAQEQRWSEGGQKLGEQRTREAVGQRTRVGRRERGGHVGLLARVQAVTSGSAQGQWGDTVGLAARSCGLLHYCLVPQALNCKMGIAVGLL